MTDPVAKHPDLQSWDEKNPEAANPALNFSLTWLPFAADAALPELLKIAKDYDAMGEFIAAAWTAYRGDRARQAAKVFGRDWKPTEKA